MIYILNVIYKYSLMKENKNNICWVFYIFQALQILVYHLCIKSSFEKDLG